VSEENFQSIQTELEGLSPKQQIDALHALPNTYTHNKSFLLGLKLGKFKAFDHPQSVELPQISLLYGKNSAGKSSLVQSFLYLNEARKGNFDVFETELGGHSVNLGGFSHFVHKRNKSEKVQIDCELNIPSFGRTTLSFDFGEIEVASSSCYTDLPKGATDLDQQIIYELLINKKDPQQLKEALGLKPDEEINLRWEQEQRAKFEKEINLLKVAVSSVGGEVVSFSKSHLGDFYNVNFKEDLGKLGLESEDWEPFSDSLQVKTVFNKLVPENLFHKKIMENDGPFDEKQEEAHKKLRNLLTHGKDQKLLDKLGDFLSKISKELDAALDSFNYFSGNRTMPSQAVLDGSSGGKSSGDAGGESCWIDIKKDDKLRERVNKYLGELFDNRYKLVVRKSFSPEVASAEAGDALRESLGAFSNAIDNEQDSDDQIAEPESADEESVEFNSLVSPIVPEDHQSKVLTRLNSNEQLPEFISLRIWDNVTDLPLRPQDLGRGVGQVIPIIAASCEPGRTIVVEQPESDLHPKQQSILADMLIENAVKNGTRFIIETHSEFLLMRLMRRIGQTDAGKLPEKEKCYSLNVDQLGVYYVHAADKEEGRTGVVVEPMEVSGKGRLRNPWPKGFFSEKKEDIFWHAST
jgi:hypothetical protein